MRKNFEVYKILAFLWAALKAGIRNPENRTGIRNPETGIRKPESKRNFKIQQSEIVQQLSGNNVNENVIFFDS